MPQSNAISRARKGVVAMFVAFVLTGLMGIVALTLDGGLLYLELRKARGTADAAAMAAACELFRAYPNDAGLDPRADARVAAMAVANGNGYGLDSASSDVEINIPPASGPYAGRAGYAEVVITSNVQRGFSRIFGSDTIPVRARAVARGAWVSPNAGVLLLDYDDGSSLSTQDNGAFTQIDGPVIVNSNNPTAVVVSGSGVLRVPELSITGGLQLASGTSFETVPTPGKIYTGTHPTPDPLAYLPPPPVPPDGTVTAVDIPGGKLYTLTPGRHANLPTFVQGDIVVLRQASANSAGGVYYLASGDFRSNGATVSLDLASSGGVMIYNASPTSLGDVVIQGSTAGLVNLKPLTSGPYTGIVIWQHRTNPATVFLEGKGNFSLTGTIYAPAAKVDIKGSAVSAGVDDDDEDHDSGSDITGWYFDDGGTRWDGHSRVGSQVIARNLAISGAGNVNITYTANSTARTRIITLVE